MKTWIHRLGSIRIAVVLLVIILVAMAAGTIIESMHGTEAAARSVYYSAWFQVLLALFAANLVLSLVDLWPWGRQRIGYVMTHGAILVILAGALVTDRYKVEGRLAIWEGDDGRTFVESPQPGSEAPGRTLPLPFSVRLDAFEIDYYQGTRMPAMFRSRVTVTDPAEGRSFPAVIEMNHELSHAGYRLFQSSYQQGPDRDQTVLLVSRDPGQPIVFFGYGLMMLGMTTVLFTRMAQQRALARAQSRAPIKGIHRAAAAFVLLGLLGFAAPPAGAAQAIDPATLETLRHLPVQHDGRVMPLDTVARETARKVTGQERWDGLDPVALVLGWVFEPWDWTGKPLVRVGGHSLAAAIGMPETTRRASFNDLVRNPRFMGFLQQARAAEEARQPLDSVLREASKLGERLVAMQVFLDRTALRVVPPQGDPAGVWSPPPRLETPADLVALLESRAAGATTTPRAIEREITYNAGRPTRGAWWILAGATAASILGWNLRRRWLDVLAVAGLLAGFGMMTWGLAVRWQVAGRIPASNMYESLLFLGWGVGLFALVALLFLRNRLVVLNATAMSALTMMLCDLLPIDPFIHPMPPVLSGTPWLAIHVPIIMVSYSILALGVLVAHMQISVQIFAPARRDLALKMNDLLYWYIHTGSIFLIAGILTGSIWAASSWGRYWGWDPKEVWSLIAFCAYLAILHGRFDRLIGILGVAALSIVAFWTILMTYIGVNFVLTAGLHSYGFGGSGVVRWMLIVAAAEALFLFMGFMAHHAGRRRFKPEPQPV